MADEVAALIIVLVVAGWALKEKGVFMVVTPGKDAEWLTNYQYAHRGLHSHTVPENSIPAFEAAVNAGYAIELDVRMTKDHQLIVFHDKELMRMTGFDGKVSEYTLEDIQKIYLKGSRERIPTLHEVLNLVDGRVPILAELKKRGFAGKMEPAFYREIASYKGKFAVQSFSPFTIRWFKRHAPNILRGQLACDIRYCCKEIHAVKRFFLDKLLFMIRKLEISILSEPNFVSYEMHRVNTKLIKKLREKGAPVFAWTVRSEEQYHRASQYTDAVIFENFLPRSGTSVNI